MITSTIVPLEEAAVAFAGGKARGLAQLITLGMRVPPGFVIIGAKPGELPDEALPAFRALQGPVAVRSSALGEDGEQASFAGQYETVLDVQGEDAFRKAVEHCLASLHSPRAASYCIEGMSAPGAKQMAVVVQRMVQASAAGVLFTLDPISARNDRMSIDAVAGLGEALVSGRAAPDHYVMSVDGKVLRSELAGPSPVVSEGQLAELVEQGRRAEQGFGRPLDMEWAFDGAGELFWLQARPITATAGDLHEFDVGFGADDVYTTANIGEMISGAVCPLTLSTTALGIDHGFQALWLASGTHPARKITPGFSWVATFNGHLFINLTAFMPFYCSVAGTSPESSCMTIVGHVVPEVVAQARPRPFWKKVICSYRFIRYMLTANRRMVEFERELDRFVIPAAESARQSWEEIDRALPFLIEAYVVHLQVSSKAGVLAGIFEGALAKAPGSAAEKEALSAGLLAGAGAVVSAQLIRELEEVLAHLERLPSIEEQFLDVEPGVAMSWLMGAGSGPAGEAFRNYLARWGHRAYRELDMREKGWGDNPLPLTVSLRASLIGRRRAASTPRVETQALIEAKAAELTRGFLGWALKKAKSGVVQREYTKNLVVATTDRFKKAYRTLAAQMVAERLLATEDDVFFFSHEELGKLVRRDAPSLSARAAVRREVLRRQERFQYPAVAVGVPEPLPDALPREGGAGELRGKPVSPGVAAGPVRVAQSAEESASLQPGEILIAPCADVGWTPYFNLIAGLVTEVGSAFCHGAVVAREYGLPTLVNARAATRILKTGDWVLLDADHGVVRRLSPEEISVIENNHSKAAGAEASAA